MKTAYEILKEQELMSREVLAAKVNGEVVGLSTEVAEGADVAPVTFAEKEGVANITVRCGEFAFDVTVTVGKR